MSRSLSEYSDRLLAGYFTSPINKLHNITHALRGKRLFEQYVYMKIFLHGLESSSKGAKATFLRDLFPDIYIPDFKGSLTERMASLNAILAGRKNILLIGSSFGGLMATIYAMGNEDTVDRLVLLAPALNFPDFSDFQLKSVAIPTWMIIGKSDTVTPVEKVMPLARRIFTNLNYNEVEDDHFLARTYRKLAWKTLLQE